jgi:cytochrome P450
MERDLVVDRRSFLTGVGALLAGFVVPAWPHTESAPRRADGLPFDFDPDYIRGAIEPFTHTAIAQGQPLTQPMIELAFSKEAAVPPHLWGMLYENWRPAMTEEGLSVFLQGLENRGPNNARKRIYMSALTPDLYQKHYGAKVRAFVDELFSEAHAGAPLMRQYYDAYWDVYWDLHVGMRGNDVPAEIREIGNAFNTVIGFWDPRQQLVYDNYMRVRELRPTLRTWIDERVQDVIDRRVENPEATFVHYWAVNGELGPHFGRQDVIFECFHNFLAFSQWGHTLYRIMALLAVGGNPTVQDWFQRTMSGEPDANDGSDFTPLDRLVMELFRTISPNAGSVSAVGTPPEDGVGTDFVLHSHPQASTDPRNWPDAREFNPNRFRDVPTAAEIDEAHCEAIGLTRCPFSAASMDVTDGRRVELPSSGFGTVHAIVDGRPAPLVDATGYAPFGFGYRRCAGEWLTVEVFKDVLRKVWADELRFVQLDIAEPARLPVGPVVVIRDDIGFERHSA